jgi:AbrB family looped-hinge helix DNA binding protein
MTTTLTVDKAGRVVLPKLVRDELQLGAGDSLELESSEDQIVLRPLRGTAGLHKKQGIWVWQVGEPLSAATVDRTLREVRREREHSWLRGGSRDGRVAGRNRKRR